MSIKLLGIDLDETLFNSNKQISRENEIAIDKAIKNGVLVVPTSGRPLTGLPDFFEGRAKYAVTVNGASVYDYETKECFYRQWMSTEKAVKLLNIADKYGTVTCFFHNGQGYMDSSKKLLIPNIRLPQPTKEYFYTDMVFVDDLGSYALKNFDATEKLAISYDFDGVNRIGGDESLKEYLAVGNITVVSGQIYNYEITEKGVSKGTGLAHLAQKLGIGADEIMVIGDDENDREMIEFAGIGVAMGNAVPKIKEIADYVTLTNNENGVAAAINKFVLKENINYES